MAVYQRLKEVRKVLKLTQTEFGEKISKTMRSIQEYERGTRTITDGVLLNLQDIFNVNIEWMRTGQGSMFRSNKPNDNIEKGLLAFPKEKDKIPYTEILCYNDIKVSAGPGAFAGMEISEPAYISKNLIKVTSSSVMISVIGDSMEPTLFNKDKIIIDTNDIYDLKKNKVYVIKKGDELYIKRFNSINNGIYIFTSDNPKYESILLTEDNCKIIGRLKNVIRDFN